MIEFDGGGSGHARDELHPGNPGRALWKYLFKKYPCKNCLVVACCSEFCKESVIFRDTIIHWTMTKHYYRIRMKRIDMSTWICLGLLFGACIMLFYLLFIKAS